MKFVAGVSVVAFAALSVFSVSTVIGEQDAPAQPLPGEGEQIQEPEEVDIVDEDRDPDTVLATVNEEEILLQDLYDEFATIPPHQQQQYQHMQHNLLEQMVQQAVLVDKALELEMDETDNYKEMMEQLEGSPFAAEFDEEDIEKAALMETLIEKEVIEKVEITDEELQELFAQYQQAMPEGADFEQMRPQLENFIMQDYVMEYIQEQQEEADVELNEEWMEEKAEEAMEAQQQMMQQAPPQPPESPEGD